MHRDPPEIILKMCEVMRYWIGVGGKDPFGNGNNGQNGNKR